MSTINVNTLRTAAGTSPVLVTDLAELVNSNWPTVEKLAAPTGSSLVGYMPDGVGAVVTTQDLVNKRQINTFDFLSPTEIADVKSLALSIDVTAKVQLAIEAAKAANLPLHINFGHYKIATSTTTFELPRDDGSTAPSYSGETVLAAEPLITMPVCLVIPSDMTIICDPGTLFFGAWDRVTVNTSQQIGILITNRTLEKNGFVSCDIEGLKLKSFFIGFCVQGIMADFALTEVKIEKCGIGICAQGNDRSSITNLQVINTYAPFVIGGWWLQRNKTQLNANLPPYPAQDVYLIGWSDYLNVNTYVALNNEISYNSVAAAIDTFFDTYFYKNINSSTRLTTNGELTVNTYRGITGNQLCVLNRYGRVISSLQCRNFKSIGMWRASVHTAGDLSSPVIEHFYVERSGYIDALIPDYENSSNILGIGVADPYRVGATALAAGAVAIEYHGTYPGGSLALNSDGSDLVVFNSAAGMAALFNTEFFKIIVREGTTNNFFRAFIQAEGGGLISMPYSFTQSSCNINPPITAGGLIHAAGGVKFNLDHAALSHYKEDTFTPALYLDANLQTLASALGKYTRIGNVLHWTIDLFNASFTRNGTGSVIVKGLPYSAVAVEGIGNVTYMHTALATTTAGVYGRIIGNEISMKKSTPVNGAGDQMVHTDINSSGVFSLRMSGTYFVS